MTLEEQIYNNVYNNVWDNVRGNVRLFVEKSDF